MTITDKQEALKAVYKNSLALKDCSDELRDDEDVVKLAVSKCDPSDAFQYASKRLKEDREFVLGAVSKSMHALKHASHDLQRDTDIAVASVKRHHNSLKFAGPELWEDLKSNREVVFHAAVCSEKDWLKSASEELQNDREFILSLAKESGCGLPLELLTPTMRADKDIVMNTLSKNSIQLQYASDDLKRDKDVVLTAVTCRFGGRGERAIPFMSPSLLEDEELVLQLVSKNKEVFSLLPPTLQRNKKVVLTAAARKAKITDFLLRKENKDLLRDREIVLAAVKINVNILIHVDRSFREDKEIAMAVVAKSFQYFTSAEEKIRMDRDIVLSAVKNNGQALHYTDPNLLNDDEIICHAAKHYNTLKGAPNYIRTHKKFVIQFLKETKISRKSTIRGLRRPKTYKIRGELQYVPDELRLDREVALASVHDKENIQYLSKDLMDDKEFVLEAITCGLEEAPEWALDDLDVAIAFVKRKGLSSVSEKFQNNKQVVLTAIEVNPDCFQSIPDPLKSDKECVIAAVKKKPALLKFAKGGLNQEKQCLIAAGIWDESHNEEDDVKSDENPPKHIVFSTRFSLGEDSSSLATKYTVLLKKNSYFQEERFTFYSPNAFNKTTCDPEWTRLSWPCRGTFDTCKMNDALKAGPAHDECCWRYSFREQLEKAKRTNGFLVQVVELRQYESDMPLETFDFYIGDGQEIEMVMAREVGTKVFRVFEQAMCGIKGLIHVRGGFWRGDIDVLAEHVQRWYNNGCEDMNECEIFSLIPGQTQEYFQERKYMNPWQIFKDDEKRSKQMNVPLS